MRAAILRDGDVVVDTVDDPTPGPGQVLVRTLACGICGSDLHTVTHLDRMIEMGRRSGSTATRGLEAGVDLVMGHEFCAEIIDFGPETAQSLTVGTRVCSMPVAWDRHGMASVGYSHQYPGGYGELMVLNEGLLLPVPDDLPTEHAALTEPMAVGRHAVEKSAIGSGELPLVIGCGPVGLAVIAALRQRGIGPIVAADFSPRRRELAVAMGADDVVDPSDHSPYERWTDLAWPAGVNRDDPFIRITGPHPKPGVVFECVGVPGVISEAFDGAMRDTRIVVVGVCMEADAILPIVGIGKELNVQFVLGYTPEEFADTLRALDAGEISGTPLITGTVPIDGVPGAFADLADPEHHAKILVDPTGAADEPRSSDGAVS